MSRVFTEGAESGDNTWWSHTNIGPYTETSTVRIGGRSYRFQFNTTGVKNFTSLSEFYFRYAFLISYFGSDTFYWRNAGTTLGQITANNTYHTLDAYVGGVLKITGTTVIQINNWYVVETHVKIDDTVGVVEYKIDGILQGTFTGDTKPGSATTVDNFTFGMSDNMMYIDDMALNNTSGVVDNSWPGDGHIYAIDPNADGDFSQWSGSDGNSTNNYQLVDETPHTSDTDYVYSSTSGQKDLYNCSALPTLPAGTTLNRVVVETRAREISGDGDSINLGVKSGTTESWSGNIVIGNSYATQQAEFINNPDTSNAWTESEINSMQIGVKIP